MELTIITIVACGLVLVAALGIYLYNKDKKEKVEPLKDAYDAALRSGDKQTALEAGRNYYRALRNGRLSIYDEQAITNDLSTMKLFLLLFLLLPLFSIAQKVEMNIDKLSGDTSFITSNTALKGSAGYFDKNGNNLSFNVIKSHNSYILTMKATSKLYDFITISKGQNLYIKTDKGIDTLTALRNEFSDHNARQNTAIIASYVLTHADVSLLNNSKVSLVRIEAERITLEYDIKDKSSDAIADALKQFK